MPTGYGTYIAVGCVVFGYKGEISDMQWLA